jgi:hypothetical protein
LGETPEYLNKSQSRETFNLAYTKNLFSYYEKYENVFNKNELSLLGSDNIFDYEYSEIPQRINISKSNLQHFKAANINILEQ